MQDVLLPPSRKVVSHLRESESLVLHGLRRTVKASPTRKWAGMSAVTSLGSALNGLRGRGLRHATICAANVENSSMVSLLSPNTHRRWCLKERTPVSHKPPKCGALGGIKRHSIPSESKALMTLREAFEASLKSRRSLAPAPWKLVAVDDIWHDFQVHGTGQYAEKYGHKALEVFYGRALW